MPKPTYCVWTWLSDEDGEPIYVGWGKFTVTHPAKHVWASRKAYDSELNLWLRSLDREPDRLYGEGAAKFSKAEASHQANYITRQLKKKGRITLSSRPFGSKTGGGSARGVLSPDLEIYTSVRQAAAANEVHPSSVTRWCKDEDLDWNYLN